MADSASSPPLHSPPSPAVAELPIPVVDLSQPLSVQTSVLHRACSTSGFFYLTSHSVSPALISRTFALSRTFFALPSDVKRLYLTNEQNRGYTAFGDETLGDDERMAARVGDTKESFYIGIDRAPDPLRPLLGHNMNVREENVPGWEKGMAEYITACSAEAMRLVSLLYVALHGGGDDDGNWTRRAGCFDEPTVLLRLLHYDDSRSDVTQGRIAAGEHTDWGMVTLLATDEVPGLQIWVRGDQQPGDGGAPPTLAEQGKGKGRWVDIPPMEGAFVVNLGDMLERWTNGRYRSTLHRVLNVSGRHRYSLPLFFEPNFDCVVECLPSCCDALHPPLYPPVKAGRYLMDRYAATQKRYQETRQQEAAEDGEQHVTA